MRKVIPLLLSLLLSSSLIADEDAESYIALERKKPKKEYDQWFYGPVIAFTPTTAPMGQFWLEGELSFEWTYATYDNSGKLVKRPTIFSVETAVDFQFALYKFIGFEVFSIYENNVCKGHKHNGFNDLDVNLGFQISTDQPGSWIPDFRILFEELFPTGKYQNLDPNKLEADLTGAGSYQTGVNLIFQKFFPRHHHNISITGSVGLIIPSSVKVRGINAYGGNPNTDTRVRPGNYLNSYFVMQYEFSRQWGFTIETNYLYGFEGSISNPSLNPDLSVASYQQLSIAPEIQHTFSENLAATLVGWGTVYGKNSDAFFQLIATVFYSF